MGTDDGGMRERKKLATREALSAAALRLALEHGPQNVRVDDIAEAAGVSPRTYNNYFSSREQAIVVRARRGTRSARRSRTARASRRRATRARRCRRAHPGVLRRWRTRPRHARTDQLRTRAAGGVPRHHRRDRAPPRRSDRGPYRPRRSGRAGARGARRRRIRRSPDRRRALATTRTRHHVLGHAERRPHLDPPRPARSRPVTSAPRLRHDPRFGPHAPRHVRHSHRWWATAATATAVVDVSGRQPGCRADSGPRTPSNRRAPPPAAGSASVRSRSE